MNEQKTNWFPADIKPVRVGVYATSDIFDDTIYFQYWNGSFWGRYATSVWRADADRERSAWQDPMWCGLTQDPNA